MTTRINLLLAALTFIINFSQSQVTSTTIQPNASSGKDALVIDVNPSSNYETLSFFRIHYSGSYIDRTFLEMDVSSIPSNAIIIDAQLKLYRSSGYASNHNIEVNRVTESWSESSVTWSNAPDVTSVDMITQSMGYTNYTFHDIDVTEHVQYFVNYPHLNYGWRLKCQNETSGNGGVYRSSDYGNSSQRPKLVVEYVLPIEITLNSITHADTPTSSNGSITVNVDEGDGTYSYQWIDGSTGNNISGETSATISGLEPGWYGVEVTDGEGNVAYMAFVVGSKCGIVQIEFQPDSRFTDDTYIMTGISPLVSDSPNKNFSTETTMFSERYYYFSRFINYDYTREILFRNKLIIPNNIDLIKADQTFYGYAHLFANGNKSKLHLNTEDWQEDVVTWNTKPTHSGLVYDLLSSTTSSTENKVLDQKTLYSNYQSGSSTNYGYTIELNYNPLGNTDREMSFYTSEYGTANKRPKLTLRLGDICTYAKPQKRLDAETYNPINGYIYFEFENEYLDENGALNYTLFDEDRKDAFNGSAPDLNVEIGDNRCSIDVSSLANGVYILELTNDKKEKFLIRFKKQ